MAVGQVALSRTEEYQLESRYVDQTFRIQVATPGPGWQHPAPDELSVVYVLDGDLFFGTVVELTRLMHQLFGELPALLVVGIAYGTDDMRLQGELRSRDFTPTADRELERMDPLPGGWKPTLPEGKRLGGAAAFLQFLGEELTPFIAGRYPVGGQSTLIGVSLGGLLAFYALLTAPAICDNYIIGSPSLWWDGEMMFDLETAQAEVHEDVAATVFLGVGSLEEGAGIPWLERFRTVTNVRRMTDRLESRGYPSLNLTTHVFADETHTSVVPAVITRGLRTVYRRGVSIGG